MFKHLLEILRTTVLPSTPTTPKYKTLLSVNLLQWFNSCHWLTRLITILLCFYALPASVSSCLHPLQLSDLLLCLNMHTSAFSSSHGYAFLFFSSSIIQLFHLMLLHACTTHNNRDMIPSLFSIFIVSLHLVPFACAMPLHVVPTFIITRTSHEVIWLHLL